MDPHWTTELLLRVGCRAPLLVVCLLWAERAIGRRRRCGWPCGPILMALGLLAAAVVGEPLGEMFLSHWAEEAAVGPSATIQAMYLAIGLVGSCLQAAALVLLLRLAWRAEGRTEGGTASREARSGGG